MRFEVVDIGKNPPEVVRGGDGELKTFTDAYYAWKYEVETLIAGDLISNDGDDPFEIRFVGHG